MAVKDGLPATDFSRMNREYIRNVAEGETVKDGLPATDFSRMNREYIKAVVEEAGGGGSSDFSTAEVTVTVGELQYRVDFYGSCIVEDALSTIASFQPSSSGTLIAVLYKGESQEFELDTDATSITTTGDVTVNDRKVTVTGNGTITFA